MKIIMTARLLSFVQVRASMQLYLPSVLSYFAVIQGAADMGIRLSEAELQNSLDFLKNLFNPTSLEDHESVAKSLGQEPLDVTAPVMDRAALDRILAPKQVPATGEKDPGDLSNGSGAPEKMVLDKVNALRVIHPEVAINNLESEPLDDYVMRLESGNLGLAKVAA